MEFERKLIGTCHFGSKIDITDPCYDRNAWCSMNDVRVVEGDYKCFAEFISDERFGVQVASIIIALDGETFDSSELDVIGGIGVDAGLAGFFNNKPDYSHSEWLDFCGGLGDKDAWIAHDGFFSLSGFGDGVYDVYARLSASDPNAYDVLEIVFIFEDDFDDDEDDFDD